MLGTLDLTEANVPQYFVNYDDSKRAIYRFNSLTHPVFKPVLDMENATPGEPIPVEIYIETNRNEEALETKALNVEGLDFRLKDELRYGFVVRDFFKYDYDKDKSRKELVLLLAKAWLDRVGLADPIISKTLKRKEFARELADFIEPHVKDIHKAYKELADNDFEIECEDEAELIGLDYFHKREVDDPYNEYSGTPEIPVAKSVWDYLVDTIINDLNRVAKELDLKKA